MNERVVVVNGLLCFISNKRLKLKSSEMISVIVERYFPADVILSARELLCAQILNELGTKPLDAQNSEVHTLLASAPVDTPSSALVSSILQLFDACEREHLTLPVFAVSDLSSLPSELLPASASDQFEVVLQCVLKELAQLREAVLSCRCRQLATPTPGKSTTDTGERELHCSTPTPTSPHTRSTNVASLSSLERTVAKIKAIKSEPTPRLADGAPLDLSVTSTASSAPHAEFRELLEAFDISTSVPQPARQLLAPKSIVVDDEDGPADCSFSPSSSKAHESSASSSSSTSSVSSANTATSSSLSPEETPPAPVVSAAPIQPIFAHQPATFNDLCRLAAAKQAAQFIQQSPFLLMPGVNHLAAIAAAMSNARRSPLLPTVKPPPVPPPEVPPAAMVTPSRGLQGMARRHKSGGSTKTENAEGILAIAKRRKMERKEEGDGGEERQPLLGAGVQAVPSYIDNLLNDDDAFKPYVCQHANCSKRFANKFLLKKHEFIHTGERPHQCPFCGKRFNRKDNLLRHKKTHLANFSLGSRKRSVFGVSSTHFHTGPTAAQAATGGADMLSNEDVDDVQERDDDEIDEDELDDDEEQTAVTP